MRKIKILRYIIFLILTIALVNFLFIFFFNLLSKIYSLSFLTENLVLLLSSLLSAVILTIVIICTVPVLKDLLATLRARARLENLSHPLLLRLSTEAPGTFHHSLTVANLANKAAKTIEADSLLCRIAGYYHDIGKLENPTVFVENQNHQETAQNLKNKQSFFLADARNNGLSKIIISHVKEGVQLAKKYQLPLEIIDLILQHHGTLKISSIKMESKIAYPGPRPLSKEAAILMLADAIEAKVRLISKPKEKEISKIIEDTVKERIKQRQLEFSGLTNFDLERIKEAFLQVLLAMHHERLPYPKR